MKTDTKRNGLRKAASLLCAAMVLVVSVGTGLVVTPLVAHAADYRAELDGNTLTIYDPANPGAPVTIDLNAPILYSGGVLRYIGFGVNITSPNIGSGDTLTLIVKNDTQINSIVFRGQKMIITGDRKLTCDGFIRANGELVIENANIEASIGAPSIHGISAGSNLTIKNSTVTAQAGSDADGIRSQSGDVFIDRQSTVISNGRQNGISAGGRITIENGASVNATGGNGIGLNAQGGVYYTSGTAAVSGSAGCAGGHASVHWETVYEADAHNDGEMVCRCDSCGEVLYRIPVSAYGVFSKTTMQKIMDAPQGATVEVKTSRWISFHKMVMQALANRPDVTLKVSFLDGEYRGNRMTFTIPAGYDALSLPNEEGYCGFLYLGGIFGLHPEERGAQSTNAPLTGT
ncbi:MAG: hypothetical protein IJR58_05040 [Lachnospiraceae bacterium]|nr:hypothetical protein [Lachnospiraceae bacterium]